ncbi:MAG: hypothetical protein AAB653_01145 [Patescibacteria group bacterium]
MYKTIKDIDLKNKIVNLSQMLKKIIYNAILIIFLVIFQIAFVNSLPAKFNNLNLILVVLIFILSLVNINYALAWAIGLGWLMDIFLFAPFGLHLISLFLTIIFSNLLLTNFFTNRSFYSTLALVGLSTIIYEFFLNSFNYLIDLFNKGNLLIITWNFWLDKSSQMVLNLLVVIVFFYFINFISKKFSPNFLLKYAK